MAVEEKDGALRIPRSALRQELSNTAHFEGVSGLLSCDEFGDCGAPQFNIMRFDDPAGGVEGLKSNTVYTYTTDD